MTHERRTHERRNWLLLFLLLLGLGGRALASGGSITLAGPQQSTGNAGSGTLTMTIAGDSVTIGYGPYSTASSIASAFAAAFSQQYAAQGLCAHAVGDILSYNLKGATTPPAPPTITGSTGSDPFSLQTPGTVYRYSVPSSGGYDGHGNVAAFNDSVTGNWSFGYDQLNRLTSGNATAGTYAGQYGCWGYDAFGNRTGETYSTTACSAVPNWVSYYPNNQINYTNLTSRITYAYDAAGNVKYDGTNTYLYDAEGRMCAVQSPGGMMGYIYDAEGHRVAKGTITAWNCNPSANGFVAEVQEVIGPGGQPVTETDGSGNWQHTNVYAGSLLLATYDAQGLHFYLADPLGTRRVQTDPTGTAEGQDTSLPWGDGFTQTASDDPTAQHYAQLSFDPETGLDHAEARQYTPWMGRWTAPDPYNGSYDIYDPQSMNRYTYAENSPLVYVDSSGDDPSDSISCDEYGNCTVEVWAPGWDVTAGVSPDTGGAGGNPDGAPSGGGGGGGSGSGTGTPAPAPKNPILTPKQQQCLEQARSKNGVALGLDTASLGIDAFGPEAQYAKLGIGLTLSTAQTINSAANQDMTGTGLGIGSYLKATTELAATSAGWGWAKWIPGAGAVMDVASAYHDGKQTISDYNNCMAGH